MNKLQQLKNNVEIVGTLLSKNLEHYTMPDGRQYISGNLTVSAKIKEEHTYSIKVFTMNSSPRTYKGIETVMNEYKTAEKDGVENADRIKVTGSLKYVQFESADGNIVEYNEIKGNFFSRIEDEKDRALISIETVVEGFREEDGRVKIDGFNIGYKEEVTLLTNCYVHNDVVEKFKEFYPSISTGRLTAALICPAIEQQNPHAFGSQDTVRDSGIKTSELTLEVIGGDLPFTDEKAFDEEKINRAKHLLKTKLQEKKQSSPASVIPEKATGFGKGADMPDFELPGHI